MGEWFMAVVCIICVLLCCRVSVCLQEAQLSWCSLSICLHQQFGLHTREHDDVSLSLSLSSSSNPDRRPHARRIAFVGVVT